MADIKRAERSRKLWSAEDVEQLKRLAQHRMSVERIAEMLGRSRLAIEQKAAAENVRLPDISHARR